MATKTCTSCKEEKCINEFGISQSNGKPRRRAECFACRRARQRQYYKLNASKINEHVKCECGVRINAQNTKRHQETKKHQNFVNSK